MKKILFLFLFFINFNITNSEYIYCDSNNINFDWKNLLDICNWGEQTIEINWISSFSWNLINNIWFFWILNNDFKNNNVNLPIWFFDLTKKTLINNIIPKYNNNIWYIWIEKNIKKDYNLDDTPIWFFDNIKNTIILNTRFNYNNPIWYFSEYSKYQIIEKEQINDIKNEIPKDQNLLKQTNEIIINNEYEIKKIESNERELEIQKWLSNEFNSITSSSSINSKKIQNNSIWWGSISRIKLRDFYINLFKKYSNDLYIKKWYTENEYNIFINNLVDLLLKKSYNKGEIYITDLEKKRIELSVINWNFKKMLEKITLEIKNINFIFDKVSDEKKIFILNYFTKK